MRRASPLPYPADFDADTIAICERVLPFTMTSKERIAGLCQAVRYVTRHAIPGAIVECGVWKGGSMMAVAATLLALGERERELYLFDTYTGMPAPGDVDVNLRGEKASGLLSRANRTDWIVADSPLEDTRRNVLGIGYDPARFHFVPGLVEETIPSLAPVAIALLRLDTDWYESTRHELEHLFPRLVRGGVLIIDDYGHWQGARRAVDEYIEKHHIPILLNRLDYTGRIAVKS